ncbi:MAG: acyloxyacyl hydrolase [Melioribacteraceae bacterium]|jgi:hypothetical protein|nr:acyloxyacyl hydrolase [Melioribacteraceae bacterium]
MKIIIIALTLNFALSVIYSNAQTYRNNSPFEISFGRGSSLYRNIKTDQSLVILKVKEMSGDISVFSYENDINLEYLTEHGENIYLIGLASMLRYDFKILNLDLFLKTGVGLNYLSSSNIGCRNLGGNFNFSEMIGIGVGIIDFHGVKTWLSYFFRHISNAGIYSSNEGYNSHYIFVSLVI